MSGTNVKISDATSVTTLMDTDMVPIARVGSDVPLNAPLSVFASYVTILATSHPPEMSDLPASAGKMSQYARADHIHPPNSALAMLDSPKFTGNPTAPTMLPSDSSDALATTQFAHNLFDTGPRAPLDSPQFIGTPRAPTPGIDDNTDLIATTEYFHNQGSTEQPTMAGQSDPGVSQRWSREDHVHPADTTRYAASNPAGYVNAAGAASAAPVQSVAARTGTISLTHSDITDWTSQVPGPSSTPPVMNGAAAVGTAATWARGDHVHASDTSRAPLAGTTTNDNAAAGQVGEFRSAILLQASAVALATGVDAVVVQLALTAGDWDVWGSVSFQMTNGNAVTLRAWINQAASQPSLDQLGGNVIMPMPNNVPLASLTITQLRVSAAAGVTMTLGATAAFGGTITAFGKIMARRRR